MNTKRVFGVAASVLGFLALTAMPAEAVEGTSSWSVSGTSGWAYGSISISTSRDVWSVTGTVKDYQAGDDCTKGIVWSRLTNSANVKEKEVRICGGSSTTIYASSDIIRPAAADTRGVWIQVCQDKSWVPDTCVSSPLYYVQ